MLGARVPSLLLVAIAFALSLFPFLSCFVCGLERRVDWLAREQSKLALVSGPVGRRGRQALRQAGGSGVRQEQLWRRGIWRFVDWARGGDDLHSGNASFQSYHHHHQQPHHDDDDTVLH